MLSVLLALAVAPAFAEPPVLPECGELPKALAAPLAAPSLEQMLSATVSRLRFSPGDAAGAPLAKTSIAAAKNKHLFAPIGLPLGKGPVTHLALVFGGDKSLKLAATQGGAVRLYGIAELEGGVDFEANGLKYSMALRPAARPWESVLVVIGTEEADRGDVYTVPLSVLYEDAWSVGVEVREKKELQGVLLVYSDPLSVQARTYAAYLPSEGPMPNAYVGVLEELNEGATGWAQAGGRRLGLRKTGDTLEVFLAK